MPKKKKKTPSQKHREQRQKRWESENKTLRGFKRKAPHFKKLLRMRGCDLPFYDFLDSYEDRFHQIAAAALSRYPTLMGIHEVKGDLEDGPEDWSLLGYGDLEQLRFDIGEDTPDYGAPSTPTMRWEESPPSTSRIPTAAVPWGSRSPISPTSVPGK